MVAHLRCKPAVLVTQALLGHEAIVTARFFPLIVGGGGGPPWAVLFHNLRALLGVEGIQVEEDVQQVSGTADGRRPAVTYGRTTAPVALLVTYNRLNVAPEELAAAIETAGFDTVLPTATSQLGQAIVIPPNVIG